MRFFEARFPRLLLAVYSFAADRLAAEPALACYFGAPPLAPGAAAGSTADGASGGRPGSEAGGGDAAAAFGPCGPVARQAFVEVRARGGHAHVGGGGSSEVKAKS